MMPSSRRARNGPLLSAGTSLSSTVFDTGITPPTIMRSMWLNVRLTSSGTKNPETWYSSRSFARVGGLDDGLVAGVSGLELHVSLGSGVVAGTAILPGLAAPQETGVMSQAVLRATDVNRRRSGADRGLLTSAWRLARRAAGRSRG